MPTDQTISTQSTRQDSALLFTTFTFSIYWFETFVVPALLNCSCEQIDVLVDAREACKSTEEATCLHAGNAYRIIPVYMPGTTVFHPKLPYLQGEHDHLVVSSANLPLAGHENPNTVSSYREPGVSGKFAGFLEVLTREHKFAPMTRAVCKGISGARPSCTRPVTSMKKLARSSPSTPSTIPRRTSSSL